MFFYAAHKSNCWFSILATNILPPSSLQFRFMLPVLLMVPASVLVLSHGKMLDSLTLKVDNYHKVSS